jgi:hypothetical protein
MFWLDDPVVEAGTKPEPFSTSKTSNWVARKGGLPVYIQHVAHDIMEKGGKTESAAIAIAISAAKKNAAKGNKQAAAAVAQWEKMKATEAEGGFWLDEPVVEGAEQDVLREALSNINVSFDEHKHPRDFHGRWTHHLGAATPAGKPGHSGITLPDGTRIQRHASGNFAVHRNGRITRHETPQGAIDEALLRSARGTEPESYGGATRHKTAEDAFKAHHAGKGGEESPVKAAAAAPKSTPPPQPGSGADKKVTFGGPKPRPGSKGTTAQTAAHNQKVNALRGQIEGLASGGKLDHPGGTVKRSGGAFHVQVKGDTREYAMPGHAAHVLLQGEHMDGAKKPAAPGKVKLLPPEHEHHSQSGSSNVEVKKAYRVQVGGVDVGTVRHEKQYETVMSGPIKVGMRHFGTFWYAYDPGQGKYLSASKRKQFYTRADAVAYLTKKHAEGGGA